MSMQKKQMKQTKRIAISAILSALGVLMLYLGSVIEVLDLTMAALASFLVILAVIEMDSRSPWLIYAVTGVLAVLILPNKFIALFYLLFAGIYPILKERFERLHPVVSWILKFSTFNTALLLVIFVTANLLHLPDNALAFTIPVFAAGNGVFLMYDIAMTQIITLYLVKLRNLLRMKNYFEN